MIDWGLVARVAGGGFGMTILVLVVLSVAVWVIGLVMREPESKSEESK